MTDRWPQGRVAAGAWTLTEAANEPFFTLVQRYVFSAYFVTHLLPGPGGTALWGYLQAAAAVVVAIAAPVLGALADAGGRRRPWVVASAIVAALACASLWFAVPGVALWQVAGAVLAASIAVEIMLVFTNAYLPDVARPAQTGLLSGLTFGFGQLAGIAMLGLVIILSDRPDLLAGTPFAVDRLSGPLASLAILLFLLPLLLVVRDTTPARRGSASEGLRRLRRTLAAAAFEPNLRRFMIGRAIGTDGMTVVFAFGGILAAQAFGWQADTLAIFGIVVTLVGAIAGFLGAWIDARLGGRLTICGGMALVGLGTIGILTCDGTRMFGLPTTEPITRPFASSQEVAFTASAFLIALGAGPAIASMRAMLARIAPAGQATAYFGLYALVGKATNFLGPLAVGLITTATGSTRLGLTVALLFLLIGIWAFWGVEERTDTMRASALPASAAATE